MKTGAFAKKYHLTPNGIRYYIAQGLLSPQRLGQHYDFDDRCAAQMEEILRLKQMHYTLDEISRIMHINGLIRHSHSRTAREKYNDIFQTKIDQLQVQIDQLQGSIQVLRERMLPLEETAGTYTAGLPLDAADLLVCPRCGRAFDFRDAVIRGGKITDASLHCTCGHCLQLAGGILTDPARRPVPMHIEWTNLLNLLTEYSTPYLNLEANAYASLRTFLTQAAGRPDGGGEVAGVILSCGGYAGDFLCKYPDLFAGDTLFIMADQSPEVLAHIRDKLGTLNDRFRILYLCDSDLRLPLRPACADLFLDDHSSSEYIFYNGDYPLPALQPYLKPRALCAGVYTYYDARAKTPARIAAEYPASRPRLFHLDPFRARMKDQGLQLLREQAVGHTKNPGGGAAFDYHCSGDSLYLYVYCGQRGDAFLSHPQKACQGPAR